MIAHCLFEQSGTFKNQFKKLGVPSYDYDILDDFGETDVVIDLFAEIESAFDGGGVKPSLTECQVMTLYLRFFLASGLKNKFCYHSEVRQVR